MKKLTLEKDILGLYVSSHPLKGLYDYIGQTNKLIQNFNDKLLNKPLSICGIAQNVKKIMTKSGKYICYMEIEDPSGRIEVAVFSHVFEKYRNIIEENAILKIHGKLKQKFDTYQVIAENIKAISLEIMIANAKEKNMYNEKSHRKTSLLSKRQEIPIAIDTNSFLIKIPQQFKPTNLNTLQNILIQFPGDLEVILEIQTATETKQLKTNIKIKPTEELLIKLKQLIQ